MKNKQLTLLPIESSFLARHLIGISTISFFEGDLNSLKPFIMSRLKRVCELNPWLLGSLLDRGRKLPLILEYPSSIENNFYQIVGFNIKGLKLNSSMKYQEILRETAPYLVQNPKIIANTDTKVTALVFQTFVDNPNKFAMIFSMSHSIVDGHSYYKVLNMLFGEEEIVALNVQRKMTLTYRLQEAVSHASYKYLIGFSHLGNVFRAGLFTKKSKVKAYYIDNIQIENKKLETCDFISTNDILTSGFFRLIGARVGFMAVNFRDKIEALSQEDAGNYEGSICYDASIYNKPSSIRKHLSTGVPYEESRVALPQFIEALFCKLGLITNWSAFAQNLQIARAKQTLHLPLVGSVSSAPYDICIVFRANNEQKGIILIHKNLKEKAIRKEIPLGKPIF